MYLSLHNHYDSNHCVQTRKDSYIKLNFALISKFCWCKKKTKAHPWYLEQSQADGDPNVDCNHTETEN
jgi:hypothetical protein